MLSSFPVIFSLSCMGKVDELLASRRGADAVPLYIAAPMVRYSKLPFRLLVRQYGVDVAYTPMIVASSFIASQRARDAELTTTAEDRPLVIQFAARSASEFADAASLVSSHVDGIDLNCGCPQSWVMSEGYGAAMLRDPDKVRDMVRACASRVPHLPVSIKIRIESDMKRTVQLAQNAEHAGAAWITVHGRLTKQRSSSPPDLDAIRAVADAVSIPVVANGDVNSVAEARRVKSLTGACGVMSARALLENPALFAGHDVTPLSCVEEYIRLAITYAAPFQNVHYHVGKMTEQALGSQDRRMLHASTSTVGIAHFVQERFGQLGDA